jgi:hypothetical protein
VILNAAEAHNRLVKSIEIFKPLEESTSSFISPSKSPEDIISQCSTRPITSVFMHVHVLNAGARRLYERYGFTERKKLENFYKKRGPDDKNIKDAWLFERDLFD